MSVLSIEVIIEMAMEMPHAVHSIATADRMEELRMRKIDGQETEMYLERKKTILVAPILIEEGNIHLRHHVETMPRLIEMSLAEIGIEGTE